MLRLLAIAALALAGLAALKGPLERQMLYPFDAARVDPQALNLHEITELEWRGDDDTVLVLWTAPPAPGKPVIFYLHGNAGGLKDRAGRFDHFLSRGYGLLAPAYRGSSGSGGTPGERAISGDIRAIWRARGDLVRGSADAPWVLYGESLGTGVAVAGLMSSTAIDRDKGAGPPQVVVLEAPFTAIPDVAAHLYPAVSGLTDHIENRWASLDWAEKLTPPLLVLHGRQDALVPIEQGRRLFDAAPAKIKRFIELPQAGHTDLWRSDVLPRIWGFIDQAAANIR